MKEINKRQHIFKDSLTIPIPKDYVISEKFLFGISNSEFISAYNELQKTIQAIYQQYTQIDNHIKDKHIISKTIDSFIAIGTLSGGKLCCDARRMLYYNNWRKYKLVLQIMRATGFEFDGLTNECELTGQNNIVLSYPKEPNVFIILKSCNGLGSLYWPRLSDDWDNERNNAAQFFYLTLRDEKEKAYYNMIHNKLKAFGLNHMLNDNGDWPIHYYYKGRKSGKDFLFNRGWIFHVRLHHICKYIDVFNECSENVKNIILSGADCNDCPKQCTDAYRFTYKGVNYSKCECYMNCFKFPVSQTLEQEPKLIPQLKIEDVTSVEMLLDAELLYM